ncbi:MAG: cell division protein ZapE [Rhodobacteraceae bacterium]|nr:cell division protein ZapE [Paracoccaceae bacterium]
MKLTLTEIFQARVKSGALKEDAAQYEALNLFEDLHKQIAVPGPSRRGFKGLLSRKNPAPSKGLYLYGGVGRGKSMLMDLFYDASPAQNKRRVHFHAFMQEIHEGMHKARQSKVSDALEPVAAAVIKTSELLCFDEMQITDITDAMIVGRLFEKLFDAGVVIVTTSNRHPDDLYKDGLNRNLFLPFIALIKERLTVYNLDSETDHRLNRLQAHRTYFTPLSEAAEMAIQRVWSDLVGLPPRPLTLTHKQREIVLPAYHGGVALASFHDLCGQPLGPGDFLMIAQNIRVLILKDIPRLDRTNNNEAKRFVTLIDALYEARVKLIASAATEPELLYEEGRGAFEFERTASRLREMQSADWGKE